MPNRTRRSLSVGLFGGFDDSVIADRWDYSEDAQHHETADDDNKFILIGD
jgi:hypothetical protein